MAEALMLPAFEMSLLSLAQKDGHAILHLIYRTKHLGLQGFETSVLETCIGDRLGLSAGLIPDKMMSQDQAWPLGHAPAQVPELRAGCRAHSVLLGETWGSASHCAGSQMSPGTSQQTLQMSVGHALSMMLSIHGAAFMVSCCPEQLQEKHSECREL